VTVAPDPSTERVWYRSLYWRIALGIIGLLIVLLVAQAIVFVWLVSSLPDALPPRALQQSARALANELEVALAQDSGLDLERFVRDRVSALSRPVVLVWRDGRVFHGGRSEPPDWLVQVARARLERSEGGPRPGRAPRVFGAALVRGEGGPAGVLMVLPGPPPRAVLRELGPVLLAVAIGLTIGGTAIAALMIFGPAHRRLRGLEAAARHLGAGEGAARAPDAGGDEIAAVARSFNAMASEIVRRAEALQAADRARRQLLADVSHELMTPLTAIRGYLETLRLPDMPLDAASRDRYLGIVLDETLRLEHIIGDLLDLARLEAGGAAFTMGTVRVADLFDRVRSRHERLLLEKQVSLESRVATGAEQLSGDADRLEQALQNLTANALRHTSVGGHIVLESAPSDGDHVSLTVIDDGEGVAPEHLPYVFDRFYKADAARAGVSGSGLGLSIVRAIAERHGGTVHVRSAPHVETAFEMRLPRTPPVVLRGA
jgi:two-component system sensor histidine kinase BaeS